MPGPIDTSGRLIRGRLRQPRLELALWVANAGVYTFAALAALQIV